jgi:8-oxo-dGTP pyrophosphatase MutT (NUDIX family)
VTLIQGFLDRVADCNRHDLSAYVPWSVAGRRIGHVRSDRVEPLLASGGGRVFVRGPLGLELTGASAAERSESVARCFAELRTSGLAKAPRGELYPAAFPVRAAPVCLVDRSYVAWLGVAAVGVHVNGFVRGPDGIEMWVGFRARDKPTFPGQLDNVVAGGQPHGLGLLDNVRKECEEEAGIPEGLSRAALPVGAISYVFENDTGIKPDTMFCFDLELPRDFEPVPVDGEVERFERWSLDRVAERVAMTRDFKFNCNLVVIDFLVRHGCVDVEQAGYAELVAGLRRGLRS